MAALNRLFLFDYKSAANVKEIGDNYWWGGGGYQCKVMLIVLEYFTAWQIEIRGESIDNSLTAKHCPETVTLSWINTESD